MSLQKLNIQLTKDELIKGLIGLGFNEIPGGYRLDTVIVYAYIMNNGVNVRTHKNITYYIDYEDFFIYMHKQAGIYYALNSKQIRGE